MELVYSIENEPLGTGGAIQKAMEHVQESESFIINGDTFFDIDMKELSLPKKSKLQLSLKPMFNFDRYGSVELDNNGYVTDFTEKAYRKSANINGGIYLMSKDIFNEFDLSEKFSFEEYMQNNIEKLHISAKVFDSYFIDIGIPDDYRKAQQEIKNHI